MTSLRIFTACLLSFVALAGCSDDDGCPSRTVVLIASPAAEATVSSTADVDGTTPGIQLTVEVQSNLSRGDRLVLIVTTEAGDSQRYDSEADDQGGAVFTGVTTPDGRITLAVSGTSAGGCGESSDSVTIDVESGILCDLSIAGGGIDAPFYSPIKVLNRSVDSDSITPGFQGTVAINTTPATEVRLFTAAGIGPEIEVGAITTTDGTALFPVTLGQGQQSLRATCSSLTSADTGNAPTTTYFVDTMAPECTLVVPGEGQVINSELDEDGNSENGVQTTIRGNLASFLTDDVLGENTLFAVGASQLIGSPVDVGGGSSVQASFTAPGDVAIVFSGQDHAGNQCSTGRVANVNLSGCAIAHLAPIDTIIEDGNGNGGDGVQATLVLQVEPTCAGLTVTTTCDVTGPVDIVVPEGGSIERTITVCEAPGCQVSYECLSSITDGDDVTTSAAATINVDTAGPEVALVGVDPAVLPCGQVVSSDEIDYDGNPGNGVQIQVTAESIDATSLNIELDNGDGTSDVAVPASGTPVTLSLAGGTNSIAAEGLDALGRYTRTGACVITVVDIVVAFSPPVADGVVGRADGTPGPGTLTLDICGTVNVADAAVTVSIDSQPSVAADVTGTTWCLLAQSLAEGTRSIAVTATDGGRIGFGNLSLLVDVTPPGPPQNLVILVDNRVTLVPTWDPAGEAQTILKYSTAPIDDGNFDAVPNGQVLGGNASTRTLSGLEIGTEYYVAVVAVDVAGNRSVPAVATAIPDFDHIATPNLAGSRDAFLGYQLAAADINDDGLSDVIVSAPDWEQTGTNTGATFIFLGDAAGLDTTPSWTLEPPAPGNIRFGFGLATPDWNGDGVKDLAVGAPGDDGGSGAVYIFLGGIAFDGGGALTTDDADVVITASTTASWFTDARIGHHLASLNFNGDAYDDLVIGAPDGGTNLGVALGGAAILFGGATATDIGLSDLTAAQMGDAKAHLLRNPDLAEDADFGHRVYSLGDLDNNGRDEVAVTSFANDDNSDRVVVWRGRTGLPAVGVSSLSFSPGSDLSINDTSTDASTYFGEQGGSIADVDGNGTRDIVLTSMREGGANNDGVVWIIDGSATGQQDIDDVGITALVAESGLRLFGSAVANNALAGGAPDVNLDGFEDLVVVGGFTSPNLYVWYGPNLPPTLSDSSTADLEVASPTQFNSALLGGLASPMNAIWAGDTNGDGVEDLCWADFTSRSRNGMFEVLWDDGQ